MALNQPSVIRHCQPCTACCDGWLRIVIDGIDVYPGHPCPHSTGSGCRIYDQRPIAPWVIFDAAGKNPTAPCRNGCGRIWPRSWCCQRRTWNGLPVDVAVPVGPNIPEAALSWLKEHALQARRPLIYLEQLDSDGMQRMQDAIAFGPQAFQAEWRDASRRANGSGSSPARRYFPRYSVTHSSDAPDRCPYSRNSL